VEIISQVGETAGKIWNLLSADGPQTVVQIRKKLNGSGEMVTFALGWLAREDKVNISQDKKSLKVTLK